MRIMKAKLGQLFVLIYLGLFILSGLFAMFSLVFNTAHSEFSGIFAILVTLPWSIILKIPNWYDKYASMHVLYGLCAMLNLTPGALINATILYYIGKFIGGHKID